MNKESMLYFAIGCVIGAVGATVVLKYHYENKMDEVEAHLRDGYKALEKQDAAEQESEPEPSTDSIENMYGNPTKGMELSPVQYNKIKTSANTTEDLMVKEAHPSEDDRPAIYILEEDDDLDRGEHYASIQLSYYVDEGLIIDDRRNTVFDEMSWLDLGILDKFKESEDTYIVLRNDDQMIDFDISKEFGTWNG